MLVLSRKAEQSVVINGEITVRIIAVRGNVVRIGIEAPQEVPIHRGELLVQLPETDRQLCPA